MLHDLDKEALKALSADYEIDFLSLSFCRMADDVLEARSFLKSIGMTNTKVQQHARCVQSQHVQTRPLIS